MMLIILQGCPNVWKMFWRDPWESYSTLNFDDNCISISEEPLEVSCHFINVLVFRSTYSCVLLRQILVETWSPPERTWMFLSQFYALKIQMSWLLPLLKSKNLRSVTNEIQIKTWVNSFRALKLCRELWEFLFSQRISIPPYQSLFLSAGLTMCAN